MKIKSLKRHTLAIAIAGAAMCSQQAIAAGSNVNGSIQGRFIDASGNEVTNVEVILINTKDGSKRIVSTGADGAFKISVPAGTYKIQSTREGYESAVVESISVGIGSTAKLEIPLKPGQYEEVIVLGERLADIQTGVAETALNMSLEDVAALPVPRDIESVALLAPGTVQGDSAFGDDKNLVSFAGASVGENAYFIDGLNVTNFRNGLGGSSVPFEFYDQFQIKAGGYGAEFGRSLGGVLNAVTKKGSNEFHYGIVTYLEPATLRSNSPDTYRRDGILYDLNSENERTKSVTDIYVSGPAIEDKLFFYALYESSNIENSFNSRGAPENWNEQSTNSDFYGLSLLWDVTDGHSITFVGFSDARDIDNTQYNYDVDNRRVLAEKGKSTDKRGGDNWLIRYDGQLTDDLNVSFLYGENQYDLTSLGSTDEQCPIVVDYAGIPGSSGVRPGCEVNVLVDTGDDKREATRIDFEWFLGDHTIKFGYDQEINTTRNTTTYSGTDLRGGDGGVYYRYFTAIVGEELQNGAIVPDANGDGSDVTIVRYRIHDVGGEFKVEGKAFYVEDTWEVNEQLTLNLGLRSETFENFNGNGDSFIKIDDQLGPRLGVSYKFGEDHKYRVFSNWGRYYLPIASNTNMRLAGAEHDFQRYFIFDGAVDPVTFAPINRDAQGVPTSTELGSQLTTADGTVPDTSQLADQNLDPMKQDEFILGFETELNEAWNFGVKYTYRELKSHIDDIILDHAIDALGLPNPGFVYVLANPGSSVTIPFDTDGDGTLDKTVTFPADILKYPEAERTYNALEFSVERPFDGDWGLKASYTYSKSRGNTEGYVKSDNGQDDAGITQDFDFPELMDGAYGYLPNDRTHTFKIFGNYQATENITLGLNMSLQSGRPINAFGVGHPNGTPSYGDTFYVQDADGNLHRVPRGSMGRTSWVAKIDASLIYATEFGDAEVELRADVFNILDAQAETEVYEFAEQDAPGTQDIRWGVTQVYQQPRTIRLGASIRF